MPLSQSDEQRQIELLLEHADVTDARMRNGAQICRFAAGSRIGLVINAVRDEYRLGVELAFLFQQGRRMNEHLIDPREQPRLTRLDRFLNF